MQLISRRRIVGQSGTDEDYFTKNDQEKPIHDINGSPKNNPLCEVLPQYELILCWAHVRNKFAMT